MPASSVLGALLFNVILELYQVVLRDYSQLSVQRSSQVSLHTKPGPH